MTHAELQQELAALGFYRGAIDGAFGPASKAAFLAALASGPDTPVTDDDFARAAADLGCDVAAVRAVATVEAAGAGFVDGLPKILFEPHRFCRNTSGRFSQAHPELSYQVWGTRPYPKLQSERFAQLAAAVALDVDAGLKSASYGAFQIMGENYQACGFDSPWHMVHQLSLTEGDQLAAFVNFVQANHLDSALCGREWGRFARGYNGTAYLVNHYDTKLATAYETFTRYA